MSDFRTFRGFEDVWRPPVRPRMVRPERGEAPASAEPLRSRLSRIVSRAPEVMVKVTGRTRDGAHLKAHLDYISRNGQLDLEGPEGVVALGRAEVRDLAEAWWDLALADSRRRTDSPVSLSVILSMPAGTPEAAVRDAARAFAIETFAGRHDYVFTLHTDTPRPHVHLSLCARGFMGERLNPKKADLEAWRQGFALALRERGVAAEATPRRARGVTRKAERGALRRLRQRAEAGRGTRSKIERSTYVEAARAAVRPNADPSPWELAILRRQRRVRALYLAQARLLQASPHAIDQALAAQVEAFVLHMPSAETRRLALVRELRAAAAKIRTADRQDMDRGGRSRER